MDMCLKNTLIHQSKFTKVQNTKSPYDGDWIYWTQRMSKHPTTSIRVSKLLKRQKGKCSHCNTYFTSEDLLEIDHILPKSKGGKDTYDNLQLLHRHGMILKQQKTYNNGSMRVKHYLFEELYEVKVSCTVLKTSSIREGGA